MPGQTTWEEALRILSPSLTLYPPDIGIQCTFGTCNVIDFRDRSALGDFRDNISGSLYSLSNGLVHLMIIKVTQPDALLRIDRFLDLYGEPKAVFIRTASAFLTSPTDAVMTLVLDYPEDSFMLKYVWDARQEGEEIISCIQNGQGLEIDARAANGRWTDSDLKILLNGSGPSDVPFSPLETVTDMGVTEFYEDFRNIQGNECIRTPVKYWP